MDGCDEENLSLAIIMSVVKKYVHADKNEFFAETEGIEPKVTVRKEKQNSAYLQWLHAFARIQS